MRSFAITPLLAAILLAASAAPALAAMNALSDADLIGRAAQVLRTQQPPVDRIIGVHKGVQVIVDDRCGDVCPANTVRIIRYMIDPGPACSQVGGDGAIVAVPSGIGMVQQTFCIPHILYRRKLYTGRPYQR